MDQLVDIAALRPSDYEQLQLLADRLRVPLTRQWRRTLRWAGRALLATHVDAVDAERIVLAAKEAGISTLVRPSHPTGLLEQFLTAHADALGTAAFIAASLGIFFKLFFFHDYRAVIHFLGLLWLHLVTRDQTVFHAVGVIAGVGASLATGYIAMISVYCALAWTRLSPPLVVTTRPEVIGDIHPLPVIRFFDWRRLRLVAGAAAIVAVLWFAATIIIHRYVRGDLPAALAAIPEANRAQLPLPTDPREARDELPDRSRARPDRRFLRGLADVDRLVLGAPSEPRIEWVDAGWKVSVGAQLGGVLPTRPSFADGLGLLRSRVRQIANGKHTPSGEAFEGGSDDDALARLRRAQHAWPRGQPLSAAAIHDAAGALALLSFHAIDNMGVGDALPSRALAALALDEEVQGTRQPALETLMAESMRYLQSAREAARSPPKIPFVCMSCVKTTYWSESQRLDRPGRACCGFVGLASSTGTTMPRLSDARSSRTSPIRSRYCTSLSGRCRTYGAATAAGDWKEPERGFAEERLLAWAAGRVKSLTSKD